MAPLSVHRAGGGATSSVPTSKATRCSTLRIAWLAATPPAQTSAVGVPTRARNMRKPAAQPVSHHIDHRLLERRAQIGDVLIGQRRDLFRFEPQRGFQPRQRKIGVAASAHRPRQRKARGIAARGFLFDQRTAGIAEAEQFRRLVEGLADGVVERAAEAEIIADAAHAENLRMAAGGEEQAIGKRRPVGEPRRERMRFQMIDGDQRLVVRERNRLRRGQPDDDAADQARAGGGGDAVEVRGTTPWPRPSPWR